MFDAFTFGNSQAAKNLSSILNSYESSYLARQVSAILHGHLREGKQLELSNLPRKEKAKLYLILTKFNKNQILGNDCIPLEIRTHMTNVLDTHRKSYLRGE